MLQVKWKQNNEERLEIIRYLPEVRSDSRTYFEKYMDGDDWRSELE